MKFIVELKNYHSKCERIRGFKKLQESGLRIPLPMLIVTPKAFALYKEKGMTEEFKKEIEQAFWEIREKNKDKGAIVRRAYFVPGLENPPGPRSSSITNPQIFITEVKKMLNFARVNKFDKSGSEIAAFLHPFINPIMPQGGGCATPQKDKPNQVLIEAIFGNDEGIQSFPHDRYTIDFKKGLILEKIVQDKPECLKTTSQFTYATVKVPQSLRFRQVLPDEIILEIARDYKKLLSKIGPHRLEFDVLKEGIYYIECTPFAFKDETRIGTRYSGKVLKVKALRDIEKISEGDKVIFVDQSVIKKRNMDLLTCLACNIPHKILVLYPGTATTAHAATILREMGHVVVYVGNESYQTGEEVSIQIEDGNLVVKRLASLKEYTLSLSGIKNEHKELVGTKAYRLAELKNEGFNIPAGFVVTIASFERFLEETELLSLVENLTLDKPQEELNKINKILQKRIVQAKIPEEIKASVRDRLRNLRSKKIAVRSSATCEDSELASFAGQFESYLNTSKAQLFKYIKLCWSSIYQKGAVAYCLHNKIPPYSVKMAVLIQKMIKAEKGGVIFTKDVVHSDATKIIIETGRGLGEKVVSGAVNPDRLVIAKEDLRIIKEEIAGEKPVLKKIEVLKLAKIGRAIEEKYGQPQDIEWAIVKGKVYILQSRPITT